MSFWYHGRMWNEEDINNKLAEYEAIIKQLEKRIEQLELENQSYQDILNEQS